MSLFKNKYRIESARWRNWDYTSAGAYFITICTQNRLHYFGKIENAEVKLSEAGEIASQFWLEIPEHFSHAQVGEFVIMPDHMHGILILDSSATVPPLQCSGGTDHFDNAQTLQCNSCTDHFDNAQTLQCNEGTDHFDNAQTLQCNEGTDHFDNAQTLQCNVSGSGGGGGGGGAGTKNQFMADISPKPGSVSTIIRSYKSACTKQINMMLPTLNFGWQSRFHDHVIRNQQEHFRIAQYIINNPKNLKHGERK
ncbi:hypothetical protein CO230_09300 [Chryseobacterium sp. 6424]|uniref:transposase n=1 Tax=Chryseobacterium sp. 6424 TaxID=2039166 RepID=UPI000EFA5064|nr:transposase [Chryseobacterium sp. 6424]AYO58293.1 hypothetical protein CO230_09300 [Chryseobacterium sp. 6424]